jgi:ABC-2 type transport system ATP-binding protein
MSPLIEAKGLSVAFNNAPPVLRAVDFALHPAEIVTIVGPNGSGKSTFLRAMLGMIPASAGGVTRRLGLRLGYVPQRLHLDPNLPLSVDRFLRLSHRLSTDQAQVLLARVGVPGIGARAMATLSGGQFQRVLLAAALAGDPELLVLDEPTAGVDIELRQMLWNNVRQLNQQGMTIILTTHYLEEAQEMCDQIAIIDKGEVIVNEPTAQVLARMDAKTLLVRPSGTVPALALPQGVTLEPRADGWLALTYPRSTVATGAVLAALTAAGVEIEDLSTTEPDLEDAFLALTRDRVA